MLTETQKSRLQHAVDRLRQQQDDRYIIRLYVPRASNGVNGYIVCADIQLKEGWPTCTMLIDGGVDFNKIETRKEAEGRLGEFYHYIGELVGEVNPLIDHRETEEEKEAVAKDGDSLREEISAWPAVIAAVKSSGAGWNTVTVRRTERVSETGSVEYEITFPGGGMDTIWSPDWGTVEGDELDAVAMQIAMSKWEDRQIALGLLPSPE